jgi:hypothetical protein
MAQTMLKSGYALTDQRCGEAPNAYPKLRIGMRDGYCALASSPAKKTA